MLQGYALMAELAAQGWVCLSIGYRVSPRHRWPRHVMDVKAAVAWARANVQHFGGDPNFVAIAGCSAGGHLSPGNIYEELFSVVGRLGVDLSGGATGDE
jgi:acetyl esterase/lipase